jgi:DNA gyrase subunit A
MSRATQGVTLFKVADAEHVVSAARIRESDDETDNSAQVGEAAIDGAAEDEAAPE